MFQDLDFGKLQTCVTDRWSPHIGDPNATGWMTVLVYLFCALMAFAVLRSRPDLNTRSRWFWRFIAALMVLLAVNKQLDLQSALTAVGRCVSQMQGWYENRWDFQRHFILGLVLVVGTFLAFVLYVLRNELRQNGVALAGLGFVGGFVAVRAVGYHHFESILHEMQFGISMNVILEWTGLVLISINALALLAFRPRRQSYS